MTSLPAPFNNCEFKICDLRGQCIGEGKCHHPIKPTDESARTIADQAATIKDLETKSTYRNALINTQDKEITDQAATIAQLQFENQKLREALENIAFIAFEADLRWIDRAVQEALGETK